MASRNFCCFTLADVSGSPRHHAVRVLHRDPMPIRRTLARSHGVDDRTSRVSRRLRTSPESLSHLPTRVRRDAVRHCRENKNRDRRRCCRRHLPADGKCELEFELADGWRAKSREFNCLGIGWEAGSRTPIERFRAACPRPVPQNPPSGRPSYEFRFVEPPSSAPARTPHQTGPRSWPRSAGVRTEKAPLPASFEQLDPKAALSAIVIQAPLPSVPKRHDSGGSS